MRPYEEVVGPRRMNDNPGLAAFVEVAEAHFEAARERQYDALASTAVDYGDESEPESEELRAARKEIAARRSGVKEVPSDEPVMVIHPPGYDPAVKAKQDAEAAEVRRRRKAKRKRKR